MSNEKTQEYIVIASFKAVVNGVEKLVKVNEKIKESDLEKGQFAFYRANGSLKTEAELAEEK